MSLEPHSGDALLVVDVQVDFLDGALAVPGAREIIPVVNGCIAAFAAAGLPVVYTRDWHPRDHVSFRHQGGRWPVHCVAGTHGARFASTLILIEGALVVSKATNADADAYSAFDGTGLDGELHRLGVTRVWVCGLATDYCVLETVKDAARLRYETVVLPDAIRGVDPGDAERAQHEMLLAGARFAEVPRAARVEAHS